MLTGLQEPITKEFIDKEVKKLKEQGYRGIEVDTDYKTYCDITFEAKCIVCDEYHYDTPWEFGSRRPKDLECQSKLFGAVYLTVNEEDKE